MKRLLPISVVLVLIAACGGGEGSDDTSVRSTSTTAATTTVVTTTTTTVTTTTVPATPWTTIPPPEAITPMVTEGFAALDGIDSICVESNAVATPDADEERRIPRALRALGYRVNEPDCQATIRIDVDAHRTSAEYVPAGTCWPGIEANGTIELLLGGAVLGTWVVDFDRAPPNTITGCPQPSDSIAEGAWDETSVILFHEVFGDRGVVAGRSLHPGYLYGLEDRHEIVDGEAVFDVVAAFLYGDYLDVSWAVNATSGIWDIARANDHPAPGLVDLVPHLLKSDDSHAFEVVTLITGEEDPQLAWEWYLEQKG